MFLRRSCALSFGWCLLVGLFLAGCNVTPGEVQSGGRTRSDDFGAEIAADEEINVETVGRNQTLHQRSQVEIRVGPSFPFDLFEPSRESRVDNDRAELFGSFEGWTVGTKGSIETQKDVFWGFAFDYSYQNVENLALIVDEQINAVSAYDRFNFLGTFDYDLPMWEAADAPIVRLGFGIGLSVFKFEDDGIAELEDLYQIVFRPSVGVRYPIEENMLLFTELSYDIVPDKSIGTTESQGISGDRPVLSSGALWFGFAFEF